jgi:hypothetical protein
MLEQLCIFRYVLNVKIREVEPISRKDVSIETNPQRLYARNQKWLRYSPTLAAMQGDMPNWHVRLNLRSVPEFFWEVTDVSVIPCRLIDGLHEWRNEITTVPSWMPLNILFRCRGRRSPVGREDPVKLYCNLSLWSKI